VTRWIYLIALIVGLSVLGSNGRCLSQLQHPISPPPSPSARVASPTLSPRRTATSQPPVRPSATAMPVATATPITDLTSEQAQAHSSVPPWAIEVPARDPPALAVRLKGITHTLPSVVHSKPLAYHLEDRERFWVGNTDTSEQFQITATLRAMTPHLYLWVEEGKVADQEALERSAQRFEEHTYPTNRALFGSEQTPGLDKDGYLTVLNTTGLGRGVAGYYSSADEFSNLVNPFSNERKMFYINLDVLQPGSQDYDSTLAHEFQHMVHWANDRNEDSWVNEGFSVLAEYLNDYSPDTYSSYLRSPDTQLTAWALTDQPTFPHYGASFLFALYIAEHFGNQEVRQVVAEQSNGAAGYEVLLARQHLSFDDIFARWVVANYLDDAEVGEGWYGYEGLTLPLPAPSAELSAYPTQQSATVHQYAADYILLRGEGNLRLTFQGDPQVEVVPNTPYSGHYQWWSNYGDESDMTLTRSIDLRGLTEAVLEFQLWFDIEEGWDYAYAEVSTDEGLSWHILAGEHTTDYNPNGNAFGVGYTGRSGGGREPVWMQERIDLSPYTGQEVLLRFEYITDEAVNHPGICVDDVAIAELGYSDDAEEDTGWEAAGFVRTDNRLEQHFLVQIIELADPPRVRQVPLDGGRHGEIQIQGLGQRMEEAVLVVSGLTPVTMETAAYTYTVELLPGDSQDAGDP
jgi:immune inhibitor A